MRGAIVAFACAALLAALPVAARAAPPNGQLVAVAGERLITVNADGTGLRTLPVQGAIDSPVWSPDGNRIAMALGGRIVVYDVGAGRAVALTAGPRDADPGWSADGRRVGFLRRGQGTFAVAATGGDAEPLFDVDPRVTDLGWAPDLAALAVVLPPRLILPSRDLVADVRGAPAWSPGGDRVAFAGPDGLQTVFVSGGLPTAVTPAPAGPPRWSPDGSALVFPARGELRTVAVEGGAPQTVLQGASVRAADWQPCTAGTLACESVSPPHCTATTLAATTQAGQPVDFAPWPCADPAGRPLSFVLVKPPDHGTLIARRYTPAPGFTGQDVVVFRMSNGAGESDPVRLTIFVVPRPAAAPPPPATPDVRRAPLLSARATPRLDARRRVLVKLACDQDCLVGVRLTANLRSRRTLKGPVVNRSLAAARVVSLRLRLPSRPRSRPKTVWITGTVRNAAGLERSVKLPVTLRR